VPASKGCSIVSIEQRSRSERHSPRRCRAHELAPQGSHGHHIVKVKRLVTIIAVVLQLLSLLCILHLLVVRIVEVVVRRLRTGPLALLDVGLVAAVVADGRLALA